MLQETSCQTHEFLNRWQITPTKETQELQVGGNVDVDEKYNATPKVWCELCGSGMMARKAIKVELLYDWSELTSM